MVEYAYIIATPQNVIILERANGERAIATSQDLSEVLNKLVEVPLERSRVECVFANLIGNALEAMANPGEVRITAEIEDGAAVVHVEDTGPGIAQEIRAQLFQPFVSAGKRNGLGLGLALSRQTVLDHGGDMWVESAPGRGARFSFRLPGARVAQAQGLVVGETRG